MTSTPKPYEFVEQNTDASEGEIIPQGIPVQNAYVGQYIQPQNQMGVFPQQYHPEMIPPQFNQQQMPQYVMVAPQYMGGAPQFLPTELHQMNPVQLMAKRQGYEREIQSYWFIVPLSWFLIVLTLLGIIVAIVLFVLQFTGNRLFCLGYAGFSACHVKLLPVILYWVIVAVFGLTMVPHFLTIRGYKKRNARIMTCLYIYFSIFFGLHMLAFCNMVGMGLNGLLAIVTYKLKTIFTEIKKIDEYMSGQGMRSQPDTQLQMATL